MQSFPLFGLGTYKLLGEACTEAVEFALDHEIELIDTASFYENEGDIGRAVSNSAVKRENYKLVSKIWTDEMRSENVEKALMASLEKLNTDYLDAYLIHWPVEGKWEKAYEKLIRFKEEGVIKSLGVCNFTINHIENLYAQFGEYPELNQVELHLRFQQEEMQNYCREKGVFLQAWRPLMNGQVGQSELLNEIGRKYQKSPYQIILKFLNQKGIGVIPKSSKKDRILENHQIFDFSLSDEEMLAISNENKEERSGPHPDNFDF